VGGFSTARRVRTQLATGVPLGILGAHNGKGGIRLWSSKATAVIS
jgi:hypothetical protein